MSFEKNYIGKKKFPHLFEPIRIGNIKLKNRIIGAPTSPSMIDMQGHFTPQMIAYLEDKARGGASMVTYGEAIVHSTTGKSHNKQVQLDSPGVMDGMARVAKAIHNAGAYANIQLSHGGKWGGLESVGGDFAKANKAYGPSDEILVQGQVYEMPRQLIYEIIESYAKAAKICKDCGFDMIQVHAAHGWLFSQFLSPKENRRTDEFGGSLENRARFLLLTLDAVRQAVGPNFPIEIRMNGDDISEGGIKLQDAIEVAKMVEDKVDLYNISCGNHEDPEMFCRTHPSAFYERGVNVYLSAEIKKHVKKPVACVGSLNYPKQMEEIISSGQADLVEIGRALLADPEIPNKALHGREDDITPCLRCYECFGEITKCEQVKCSVNPKMGQQLQLKYGILDSETKKKVLIVGGGPAGMQAAITLSERGHDVTLVEKEDRLGGNLNPGGSAYFKSDILKFCKVMIKRIENLNINVILNKEVDEDFVKEFKPEVLFIAIGANELKPNIEGIDLPNVIMANDAELHHEKLGKKVVIMGGGLVGAEAAISFAHEGKKCSIIEMKSDVATEVNSFYRGGLMPEVYKSADIYVNTKVKKIVEEGVICEKDGEEFLIKADSIVCALGFRAPYDKVDSLSELVNENYIIGDCRNVGQIHHAINQGYFQSLLV